MYAAAGGASIANRRKQKRLQQKGSTTATPQLSKLKVGAGAGGALHHQHQHHHHQHQHSHQHASSKYARASQNVVPAPPAPSSSSHAFHHSRRRPEQLAPVSPIPLFPISPPPLSIESSPAPTAKTKFPFPPSSILDLRVVPSTSELQCSGAGPGKAAWQGCNRPSPLPDTPISPHGSSKTKQCEAHRRWMKRNRIRDASYCYGSSGEEDDDDEHGSPYGRRGEVSAAVNTMLYAGLGTTALGLVISFVGTGEKGFLSPELRLIGPSLLCAGLLCCLLRVLLCLCLCKCTDCRWRQVSDKEKSTSKMEAAVLPTASLLPPPAPASTMKHHYKKHLQASPPSPQLDTKSCTAPLSLTPSPSPSPTPVARSSSPTTKLQKEAELLLSPSQLYDPTDT